MTCVEPDQSSLSNLEIGVNQPPSLQLYQEYEHMGFDHPYFLIDGSFTIAGELTCSFYVSLEAKDLDGNSLQVVKDASGTKIYVSESFKTKEGNFSFTMKAKVINSAS